MQPFDKRYYDIIYHLMTICFLQILSPDFTISRYVPLPNTLV